MNTWFVYLILTCACTSTVRSEESKDSGKSSKSALGSSACGWYGTIQEDCEKGVLVRYVPCDKLPSQCSALIWESVTVNWSYDVINSFSQRKDKDLISELEKCKKPVFIKYGYLSYGQWTVLLACCASNGINVRDEMEGLKAYLSKYQFVTGLMLKNLEIDEQSVGVPGLTEGLITYVSIMKETFPKLEVGLNLNANLFMDYFEIPKGDWLDFKKLNDIIDFYAMTFIIFNPNCTADLRTGMIPVGGSAKYTLEKLQTLMKKVGLPKEKIYLKFELSPQTTNPDEDTFCKINYQTLCQDPKTAANWCADNTQTIYDKGLFTNQHAQGFIQMNVDLDDPDGCCSCGPFPIFHLLLDGFNCCPRPTPCPLLDRS